MSVELATTSLPIPVTGEVVDLADYQSCARALDSIRDIEYQLRTAKAALSDAIAQEAARRGVKSLELGDGRKAVVGGGTTVEYDAEQMEIGLRTAGMPEDRIREIVEETVTYKVKAGEAKRAAGANPDYAVVVDACRREIEKPAYVSLRRT
jgi:hypothetical protein